MEELSIEEKAERYDEAIERANSKWHYKNQPCFVDVAEIFPELAYSEDVRIKRKIRKVIDTCLNIRPQIIEEIDYLQIKKWLEKQGDQKPAWTPMDEQHVENLLAIIEGHGYPGEVAWLNSLEDRVQSKQGEQNPADKKGMNLVEEKMTPFQKKVFCIIDTAIEEEQGLKQVCDELFALASNEIKQKSAWCEEDEKILDEVITNYESGYLPSVEKRGEIIEKLKSLKERVQSKPMQEWSEEDEQLYNDLSDTYFYNDEDYPEETYKLMLKRVLDWMNKRAKSLTYKPSDEQIKVCKEVYADILSAKGFDLGTVNSELNRLEEQLKKLREE